MVGIQMVKLTLFAIFLPSIIGSVGKIVSKGFDILKSSKRCDTNELL